MAATGPILFEPMLKSRPWGGSELLRLGRLPPGGEGGPFGESWELADLPGSTSNGSSRIVGGPFGGRTLAEAIRLDRDLIMGRASLDPHGRFPLLVKLLDAASNLSLQVHPSDAYARLHPEARPKIEAWFVLRASPGAIVHRGVDPRLRRDEVASLISTRRLVDRVRREPVREGDFVILPSGICHALGGGVLVVEIQTPSETTFRLWDWDRNDPSRPLQVPEALESMLLGSAQHLDACPIVNESTAPAIHANGMRTVDLCRNGRFEVEHLSTTSDSGARLEVITDGQPVLWIVLSGRIEFDAAEDATRGLAVGAITTVLLPAASHGLGAVLAPDTSLLRVTLPDRMRHMLAGQA